jgi:hypothetical protein
MAVLVISKPPAPGPPLEMYDADSRQMNIEADPPAGLIAHAVIPGADTFEVYDIWESQAQADDFIENRLKPAIRAVAGDEAYEQMPDAERSSTEIHHLVTS